MKPITHEWVSKAENDYTSARILLNAADEVYDAVCFHAQQCCEKYLKAWLIEQDITFPRIHDLEALAKLCALSASEVGLLMDDLRLLTSYAVEVRYPGASADRSDAEACLTIATKVRSMLHSKLTLEE
jgi:HEPN domain-containing protein